MTNTRKVNDRRLKKTRTKNDRRFLVRRQEDVDNKLAYYCVVSGIGTSLVILGIISYIYGYNL